MPAAIEMLRRNRPKLLVLLGVILFAIGLGVYYSVTQSDTEDGRLRQVPLEDYTWDDAERIKVANKTKGNSTLVFATVVRAQRKRRIKIPTFFSLQIFRHGDRNPTNNAYKTDPYANGAAYIGGWGALTLVKLSSGMIKNHELICQNYWPNKLHFRHILKMVMLNLQKGKRRMYLLGQHIRKRYSAFLPPLYLPEHLYVLSSDADRCIMSAECFLTALYPPLPFQKIHPELNWQPIPVHTVPRDLDRVKNLCL